ncbi:hypothetical protein [Xylanimonas protaetiae]|uniref:DUF4333 domain-containing protein n=1 Tax=Xylanimonas protaetiae TaxID=2509457 RepID=A0A4V0YG50_9MICO|nr:hypothetical protein [Xylanimonas protaetiae]QAY69981.1 hypothetical protein ET471_08005 [Xylanimonas protaetiae]
MAEERRPLWARRGVVISAAITLVLLVAAGVGVNQHGQDREAAGRACEEQAAYKYPPGTTLFRTYVGEPDPGRFEYRIVDIDANRPLTCLVEEDDGAWVASYLG